MTSSFAPVTMRLPPNNIKVNMVCNKLLAHDLYDLQTYSYEKKVIVLNQDLEWVPICAPKASKIEVPLS